MRASGAGGIAWAEGGKVEWEYGLRDALGMPGHDLVNFHDVLDPASKRTLDEAERRSLQRGEGMFVSLQLAGAHAPFKHLFMRFEPEAPVVGQARSFTGMFRVSLEPDHPAQA